MIFAKVDVSIYSHPKFIAAGFDASGYWLHALAYLRHHESADGFLANEALSVPISGRKAECRRLCEKLVSVGLFAKVEGGYVLLHYCEKNQSKADIDARREAAKERKAKGRARAGPPPDSPTGERGAEVVSRDIVDGVTRDMPEAVTRPTEEVSHARSISLSSSLSLSVSDLKEGGVQRGEAAPDGEGGTPVARRPLPPSERALAGPAWLSAFGEGITQQTGRPCSVGRMYVSTLERVVEHHAPQRDAPSACTWLRDQAAAFAKQWDGLHPPKGLTPDGLERWLNDGRVGPPQFGKQRIVQLPADQWKDEDYSGMGVLEVITAEGSYVPSKTKGGGSS